MRETTYDEVADAQRHFRSLLDSMSRPGTINPLARVDFAPSPGFNRASALVAFALLNADVSFCLVNGSDVDASYLVANTRARVAPIEQATFIFADGTEAGGILEGANCGSLTYPDTSATIVIQVEALSAQPLCGALKVTIHGPGVDGAADVFARGLSPDLLLALQARNAEFPLGIDAIVTCDDKATGEARVLGLPRTARLAWQQC